MLQTTEIVVVNGVKSDWAPAVPCVKQGTVLGLLFLKWKMCTCENVTMVDSLEIVALQNKDIFSIKKVVKSSNTRVITMPLRFEHFPIYLARYSIL